MKILKVYFIFAGHLSFCILGYNHIVIFLPERAPADETFTVGTSWSEAFENTRVNFSTVNSNRSFKHHSTAGKWYTFMGKKVRPIFILIM